MIVSLLGCDDILDRPLTNQFVVEGYLTADAVVNDIGVKETATLDTDEFEDTPITDAQIRLITETQSIDLEYDEVTKKYFAPDQDIAVSTNDEYRIEITNDGITASASTIIPEKPTGLTLSDTVVFVPTLALNFSLRSEIQRLFEEEVITLTWDRNPG